MISLKIGAVIAAAFIAGAFAASPELRAYAANTVFSTDIVDGEVKTPDLAANAVTAAKVKDGEIKAADIATDAVGAAEIQGVTKLLFGQCDPTTSEETSSIGPGGGIFIECAINGVDASDFAIATLKGDGSCFYVSSATPLNTSSDDKGVDVNLKNNCEIPQQLGSKARIAVIVYEK